MRGNTTHWVVVGATLLAAVAWGTLVAGGAGTTGDASASAPGGGPAPARPSSPFVAGPATDRAGSARGTARAAADDAQRHVPLPSAAAEPASSDDAAPGPDRALVRHALAEAFTRHFPDAVPSEARLDRLTDTLLELRAHREALRRLPVAAGTAERRRVLQQAMAEAVARFEETAEVPLDRFSETAEPDTGLTREEDEDDVELRLLQP